MSPKLWEQLGELTGARLLCHCRAEQSCHGDVLVRLWRERFGSLPAALWTAWQVYIDNLDILEVVPWECEAAWKEAGPHHLALHARSRSSSNQVPRSEKKAVVRETSVKSLGDQVDGVLGSSGADPQYVRQTLHLLLSTLNRQHVTKKWLQILGGRLVRLMLYRRETMMVLDRFWKALVRWRGARALPSDVAEELLAAVCLFPVMSCNLRLPVNGVMTVSDASLQRGALCRSVRVTPAGVAAAQVGPAQQ